MKQNILIVGSGGREHALGWKLSESQSVSMIYYCPGNGGTINNLSFSITDFYDIKSFAKKNKLYFVVCTIITIKKGKG